MCSDLKLVRKALTALVNAVEDAMETPEEAASWARTGDMNDYIRRADKSLKKTTRY